jgi:predicted cupin superfamily sugar epimerase
VEARDLIQRLSLQPHPEGGWYRQFYRSAVRVRAPQGERAALTSIHYLLEREQRSRWHVVESDELWQFQGGAPLELLAYQPASFEFTRHVLADGSAGDSAAVIARGVWQAARSLGEHSLVSCSVAPGFEFSDFRFVCDLADHARHFQEHLEEWAQFL